MKVYKGTMIIDSISHDKKIDKINGGTKKKFFCMTFLKILTTNNLTPLSRQFLASLKRFSSNSPNRIRLPSSSINRHKHYYITNKWITEPSNFTVGWVMDVPEWLDGAGVCLSHENLLVALGPSVTVEETLLHVTNDVPQVMLAGVPGWKSS
jgi:hypothetical protein